jgi:hypothetical protein
MKAKTSVSFTVFIPIRQRDEESSHLYLYYYGLDSNGNRAHAAFERKHTANGDLRERLTVSTKPRKGFEPASYGWQLDEQMPDASWVQEILDEIASTQRGKLKAFLARCFRDATRDPVMPFRAVFSASAKSYGFLSFDRPLLVALAIRITNVWANLAKSKESD